MIIFIHFESSLLPSRAVLSLGSCLRLLTICNVFFCIFLSLWIWMLIRKLRWTRLVHITKESRRKWYWLILLWATCYFQRQKEIEKKEWEEFSRYARDYFPSIGCTIHLPLCWLLPLFRFELLLPLPPLPIDCCCRPCFGTGGCKYSCRDSPNTSIRSSLR